MKKILSIQSHVAYGYVGNRAALFPLQRMGFDVSVINTVQFSNHPGYGRWTGDVFSADHIRSIINGLRDLGVLYGFDAVLSGYLGDARTGQVVMETVADIKKHNPACLYCCDPVMGDRDRGLFVKPDIPALFKNTALRCADILTPNVFELEQLADRTITTLEDARAACRLLHKTGVETVLVTSLFHKDTQKDTIEMLASRRDGTVHHITTPYLHFNPMPNGTGDLTAALFLGAILKALPADACLTQTANAMHGVLESTEKSGGRELAIISGQSSLPDTLENMKNKRWQAVRLH